MTIKDDSAFDHDDADITMVSYILAATTYGKNTIHVLSDDTGVFYRAQARVPSADGALGWNSAGHTPLVPLLEHKVCSD